MVLLCPRCGMAYRSTVRHCPNDNAELQPAGAVDSRLGTVIGHYRLMDILGKGGMGSVYVAEHIYIGKMVAIKILHEQYAAESDAVGRLLQEARAAAGIGHANIVAVSDFGETPDGLAYLVMEYVEGKPLDQLLEEEAPFRLFRAINIVNQIGSGLSAAHEKGIVHRDLKPENVMLQQVIGRRKVVRGLSDKQPTVEMESTYDHVKILDFGVAKILDLSDPSRRTISGTVIGTPHYMAPETARARTDVDHRIDIYSLGVMFYEMLTASLPFDGNSAVEVMLAHCSQPLTPPREKNPLAEVSDAADALIRRALAKEPADRQQHMDEFLVELQGCYGDENFLRNVEKQAGGAAERGHYARPRSLTEDLKDLFAGGSGGGNEILERAFLDDGPDQKKKK